MSGYDLVVIDPPWSWRSWSAKGAGRAPRYRTIDDMGDIPLPDLLNRNAVVVMWVVDPMLPHAVQLGTRWGLKYSTVGLYWTKHRASGAEHVGLGYYTRANPEQAWIWTRGAGLPVQNRAVRRWLHAPVGKHSAKPDESYARLETLFGDVTRADVFARAVRKGWDAYGDEIDGRDITDAIRARKEPPCFPSLTPRHMIQNAEDMGILIPPTMEPPITPA